MAIYKRNDSDGFSYDFIVDGRRYSGPTGTSDLDEAKAVEASIRGEIARFNPFCMSIIKKARRAIPETSNGRKGYVYMLKSGYFIKIGRTVNPAERLKAIQTATPEGCEILFVIPGDMRIETKLHAEFAACHYRGEWFFHCGKLKQFIERFDDASAGFDAESPAKIPPLTA